MFFRATPTNMTAVLICVIAAAAVFMLARKRYDTNLPLLFYFFALVFANMADRPVEPAIMYGGLAFALLLRFEFMGAGFTKTIAFAANVGLCLMIWVMLAATGT
jgi:hypothetical protein